MKKLFFLGVVLWQALTAGILAQSVTTVVTNQPGGLTEPYAVAVDAQENLYITDSANHRITRFKTQTGELTTFAGKYGEFGLANGTLTGSRFFDPRGIVFARGGLVVADSGNHSIRFINLANNTVTTLAGTGKGGYVDGAGNVALFRSPQGVAADALGNIYVADSRNRVVRKIDTANNVSTVATDFVAPAGIAVGDANDIYVADRLAHTVTRVQFSPGVTLGTSSLFAGTPGSSGTNDGVATVEATLNVPESVLWLGDTFGLLISDSQNHTLRRVRSDTNLVANVVETYAGAPGIPGAVDGPLANARFGLPTGLVRYSTGFLIVEAENDDVRQILTSPQQPRISDPVIGTITVVVDKETGKSKTKLIPVTDETFNDTVTIGVLSERGVRTFFTAGPSRTNVFQPDPIPEPTANSNTAPDYQDGLDPSNLPPTLTPPLPDLTVKAISMADGRTASRVTQATFRFQVGTPSIDAATAGSITVRDITAEAQIYYTLDGTDPTEGVRGNPSTLGPKSSGDKIPLLLGTSNVTVKVKAFRTNFKPSSIAAVDLSATNFTPNRISFGFAGGEASSDFVASAGQRFYAPVTLTLVPGQTMYGLQFNLQLRRNLTNNPGPPAISNQAYGMAFQSMLMQLIGADFFVIPPQAFVRTNITVETFQSGTNSFVTLTNYTPVFTNLLFTNLTDNLMGVGWVERAGLLTSPLFPAAAQDLITYSIAHDTLFKSANGKVVTGGFSFIVPTNAQPGQTYEIEIDRASGTEDGISSSVILDAPKGDSDPRVTIRAKQTVTVGSRAYIVGDVAPIRWFNGGDFGDGYILNNDITQAYEASSLLLNTPPLGSDFFDAMDSCCVTAAGVNLNNNPGPFFDGTDTTINSLAFGDGQLDISDLFVSFRRALDPSLTWYQRYWSNGVRQARSVSNVFPTPLANSTPLTRQSIKAAAIPTGEPPFVTFSADNVQVGPGNKALVPIRANIVGGYPLRVMYLNLTVSPFDGAPALTGNLHFVPSPQFANPTFVSAETPQHTAAGWLNDSVAGVLGNVVIGTLEVQIPTNAPPNALYVVSFSRVSASPTGIGAFKQATSDGVLTMAGRTAFPFNDGLPDSWRLKYFNSLLNLLSAASADADGDGVSNLDEFRAGTNPVELPPPPTPILLALSGSVAPTSTDSITLKWPSIQGQSYTLERSPSLTDPSWTIVVGGLAGNGGLLEFTDNSPGTVQFYRVRLSE